MFKRKIIGILLIFVIMLTGCGGNTKDEFLGYQNINFSTCASMEINGEKYTVKIDKTSEEIYNMAFISPNEMSGVSIEKKEGTVTYSVGGVHIPIEEKTNVAAMALGLFELVQKELVSADTELLNGVRVNVLKFKNEEREVTLYISSDSGLPIIIDSQICGNTVKFSFSEFIMEEQK